MSADPRSTAAIAPAEGSTGVKTSGDSPIDAQVFDPATQPAIMLGCDRCQTPTLLRPGGLCADCIAVIGLAEDQTEYWGWRERVEEEVAAGGPGRR